MTSAENRCPNNLRDGRFMWAGKVDDPLRGWPFKCYLYWGLHHSSPGRWNLSSVSSLSQFPNLSMHQNTRNTLNRWIQQTWDRIQELANSLKGPGSGLTKPWESCHWFPWPWNTLHHSFFSFLQGRYLVETVETFQSSMALSAPNERLLPKSQAMWQLLAAGDIVFLKRKRGAWMVYATNQRSTRTPLLQQAPLWFPHPITEGWKGSNNPEPS